MWGWDILREVPNIDRLVWLGYLTHVSDDISAPRYRINLRIALLEPSCKVGRFEYNKAYIWKYLFFGLKGDRVDFLVKTLIPKTHFFHILTPFLDYIYIKTLIFNRIIIISVQVELSPRPIGCWAECLAFADPGARTPISVSRNLKLNCFKLEGITVWYQFELHSNTSFKAMLFVVISNLLSR